MSKAEVKSALKDAIKINSTDIEPCLKKVEYTIPAEAVKNEKKTITNEYVMYAAVPGFRKGKAPASMIISKFKPQIEEELMRRFYMTAFDKTNEDQKMEIVSYAFPKEGLPKLNDNEDYKFTVNFDVAPEIELPEYKGIKIDSAEQEITEKEIQESVDYYKNLYSEYKNIDTAAQKEDMLKVSYTSDYPVTEATPANIKHQVHNEETWIWLNEPESIPGSIAALTGAEKGKEVTFASDFPADYKETELAGKKVTFTVSIKEIQRRVPIESEQALCEKMKVENIEKLREQVKENILKQKESQNKMVLGNSIVEKLLAGIKDFPIPPSILSAETQKELRNIATKAVKSEKDVEKFKEEKDKHQEEAKTSALSRMRRFFVLKKIAKLENIKVEESEVDNQIKGMSRYYGYKEKELRRLMENSGTMDDVYADLLVGKTTEFLVKNAEINTVKK